MIISHFSYTTNVRPRRIELLSIAWEAIILPLNHGRVHRNNFLKNEKNPPSAFALSSSD